MKVANGDPFYSRRLVLAVEPALSGESQRRVRSLSRGSSSESSDECVCLGQRAGGGGAEGKWITMVRVCLFDVPPPPRTTMKTFSTRDEESAKCRFLDLLVSYQSLDPNFLMLAA